MVEPSEGGLDHPKRDMYSARQRTYDSYTANQLLEVVSITVVFNTMDPHDFYDWLEFHKANRSMRYFFAVTGESHISKGFFYCFLWIRRTP